MSMQKLTSYEGHDNNIYSLKNFSSGKLLNKCEISLSFHGEDGGNIRSYSKK
jgi:hypothetical protein